MNLQNILHLLLMLTTLLEVFLNELPALNNIFFLGISASHPVFVALSGPGSNDVVVHIATKLFLDLFLNALKCVP